MAIGDQVHWMGSAGNTDLRPSSGVEIIIKDITSSYYYTSGYHYYMYIHWRNASSYQDQRLVLGGNSYATGNSSSAGNRASNSSTDYSPNIANAPINNANYLRSVSHYSGYYHVGGYITKD